MISHDPGHDPFDGGSLYKIVASSVRAIIPLLHYPLVRRHVWHLFMDKEEEEEEEEEPRKRWRKKKKKSFLATACWNDMCWWRPKSCFFHVRAQYVQWETWIHNFPVISLDLVALNGDIHRSVSLKWNRSIETKEIGTLVAQSPVSITNSELLLMFSI